MIKIIYFLVFSFLISISLSAQPLIKGPYTVKTITDKVYNIEDANESNPAGMVIGDDGQVTRMNNCSDMYLIKGDEKALLIDLSNDVKWDNSAGESLRSIVYGLIGDDDLFITLTHKHGDHLGMLSAFKDEAKAKYWISATEFKGMNIFPGARTTYFHQNASLDLGGGMIIYTMELPGHTDHSTLFFLQNKNMVFTGDAIGSGSGVWLFNEESFYTYITSIDRLLEYIKDPQHNIDPQKLTIYGGHMWQKGKLDKLTIRYLYDMKSLIERMGLGISGSEKMTAMIPFMDTNFRFGTAAISWNREAAERYAKSVKGKMGKFTRISKHQDYGLTITRLVVDLGDGSNISEEDLTRDSFKVQGFNKSNTVARNIKKLSITDSRGYDVASGSHVTIDLDFGFDADSANAYFLVVTLNKDMGKYHKGAKFIQNGRTIRR